jgi:hypothetical protein
MKVSSELGELDERATDMAFQKAQSGLAQCFSEGLARVDYLSGEVSMFVRIGENGAAKIARLASSTLGDRRTETCMVSVLQRAAWPKPAGGEGEAKKTLTFDPPSDVRAPSSWPGDRVSSAVATHRGKLKSCQAEGQGRFSITAYVGPDSHHGGKVLAVGGASKAPEDDAKLDCVLDAIKEWKLPSPGSYAAKVTFSL